jgi:hypothetical protein
MIIAWTSLYHAIFIRRRTRPYYRKPDSPRFQKIDGEYKYWELGECLAQAFKGDNPPLRKNLEFFIVLRNKIEHRSIPELDPEVFGECQAMLMNYESLLCSEFGDRYAIHGGLTFSLQFARSTSPGQRAATSLSPNRSYKTVRKFIDTYRSSLTTDVLSDLEYSFKVYLVPKIGGHASKDAVAIEWVPYDPSKPEEMERYEKVVAMIKTKQVSVANLGLHNSGEVVQKVSQRLGKPFNQHHHLKCSRHFAVRPARGATDPAQCNSTYCLYDTRHRDYGYTDAWISFLIEKLSDPATYNFITTRTPTASNVTAVGGASTI